MELLVKIGGKLIALLGFMIVFIVGCIAITVIFPTGHMFLSLVWLIILAKIFKGLDKA